MASRDDGYKREEDDDGDEEVDETNYKTQKDAIIFAIDVSASMLQRPPPSKSKKADQDSAVSAALRVAYRVMQQRIIAQPKDLMGLLFFGTNKSKFRPRSGGADGADDDDDDVNDDDRDNKDGDDDHDGAGAVTLSRGPAYPHCYLFMDLDVPAAEDVRALKALVEDEDDPDEVLVPAPPAQPVTMANVLFCANQVFTTNAPNFGSRRLFIITDNDDPHKGDKVARSAAAVRAKDLYDLGVVIELFPISRAEKASFDLTKFYDDIIYRDPAAEAGTSDRVVASRSGEGLTLLSSLISNINAKQTPKRAYFSNLTFEVAPGLAISIKGYILLNRQKPARTCYVWLEGEEAQIATGETVKVDAESARTVEAAEIKKAYKFGGEYVYFTPDELKELKRWEFPPDWKGKGLRIIGFKPRVLLPPWASVKRSTFVYPSEEDYVGSTRVFSALWHKLRRSDKFAVAWFVPRTNANPLLVAILPSNGPGDDDDDDHDNDHDGAKAFANPAQLPAGLWLYPLPFAEDIRRVDDGRPTPLPCPATLTDMVKPIVENLFLPKTVYDPAKYPNPALQWHYKILQTLALDEEVPSKGEDLTLPKYKAIDKRVGGSLAELKDALQAEAKKLQTTRAIKREADEGDDDGFGGGGTAAAGKPLSKRPKTAATTAPNSKSTSKMTGKDLRSAVNNDTLKDLPVVALKEVLSSKGLSVSGKKAELVERIEQWVEENL
ncbi:dsb repair complex subunit [Niveomyces insectorum RCEF 264]|uniref:ATP-dependent DNA helicase II subunit 1 n=1 Tax=Niveomyces insectorum RCEF 264 TaxID=1081102 RepID=A0A167Y812_9HYPO|nr:dsb repair complex subunit [Niveomyces insectorum RCEF 264]